MNQQKNQEEAHPTLLQDIQNEVSPENAPLLSFITRHAGLIAGTALLLLLILGCMAVWNWHQTSKREEARMELARINMELKGKERDAALNNLAANAPENAKIFIYMSLGQSAQENGNPALAAEAYAKAASLDGDGPLGLAAALGNIGSLLMQTKYTQALALLQELEARLPQAGHSPQLRQMLAETAARAGRAELAQKTYLELAEQLNTPEAAYFRSRAEAVAAPIKGSGVPAAPASENAGQDHGQAR